MRTKKMAWVLLGLLLAALLSAGGPAGLALAELSFSFYTQEHGIGPGFLKYLAQDGLVFRPRATLARPLYEKVKPGGPLLAWRPQEVSVAASGDLGMSWGPYTLTAAGAEPVHGHYFSVWKLEGGAWRLYLDLGISHPKVTIPVPDWSVPLPRPAEQPILSENAWRDERDRLFARESSLRLDAGNPVPFLELLDPGIVLLREGGAPARGTAGYEIPKHGRSWHPQGGALSAAGDLGCLYGEAVDGGGAEGKGAVARYSYLHVWRWDSGRWRLIAEALLPLPSAEGGEGLPAAL